MTAMERTPIESSTVAGAAYDATDRILEIEFTSGAVYHYLDVPVGVLDDLLTAESPGRYLNHHIRDAYAFIRLEG
jgi:hypothetical protein